jgi:peptide/nickel transport system ATP-binding protein
MSEFLHVSKLGIGFGEDEDYRQVVNGVSFGVAKGEALGLIGESGCGKSTILRCLAGLNTDYDGEMVLDGKVLTTRRSKADLRRMQMVFQDPYASLHPRKMVRDVLLEPLAIHGMDRREERVSDVLVAVGLGDSFRYRFPHQLSGGQRQRIAIARSLITEPEILLLDEPTSALDVSVQAEILNLLVQLRRERGLTYIMVTHDLAVVAHVCSQIAIMQNGRITEMMSEESVRAGSAETEYAREFLAASRYGLVARGD